MKCHFGLPKAQPCDHTSYKAILLRHTAQRIQDFAVDQPKVANISRDRDRGHSSEQLVKQMCRGALECALTHAGQTAGGDDLTSLLSFFDHLSDDLRRDRAKRL